MNYLDDMIGKIQNAEIKKMFNVSKEMRKLYIDSSIESIIKYIIKLEKEIKE